MEPVDALVMHVDLDAFYASVEQRDHPEMRGRPVVVGAQPGRRGVVATCSYEARVYGVRSAMPISDAARRLPPETVYVRPRMDHYVAVSGQIMQALCAVSPVVEKVSIDEAYLDVSGLERLIGTPEQIGGRARRIIKDAVGLNASVGIGPNRLVAKLASEACKPDGLGVVLADDVQAFLDPQPLSVLRGVGAKTAPLLQRLGLRSVADVRGLSLSALRQHLGAQMGLAVYEQARGIASARVSAGGERKSISKETTFGEDSSDPDVLKDVLRQGAQEVAYVARREGRVASLVTLKVRFKGFETHTRSRTLAVPSDDPRVLYREAWRLFEAGAWQGRAVRLIGIGISGWAEVTQVQPDLFAELPVQENGQTKRLNGTLDEITEKFGRSAIGFGAGRRDKS